MQTIFTVPGLTGPVIKPTTTQSQRTRYYRIAELVMCNVQKQSLERIWSAHLKLDDGVLVDVDVPGGDGMLAQLAGDKHHG